VTETSTTAGPVFPAGRYGRRREPGRSRRLAVLLSVVGALLGLTVAGVYYQRYGDHTYAGRVVTSTDATADGVTVRLEVHKPAGEAGVCRLRAFAPDRSEVGYAEVPVPAAERNATLTYRLSTTGPAVPAQLLGCRPATR
jgi:hypothetical protein